jgi:hypothetical protein
MEKAKRQTDKDFYMRFGNAELTRNEKTETVTITVNGESQITIPDKEFFSLNILFSRLRRAEVAGLLLDQQWLDQRPKRLVNELPVFGITEHPNHHELRIHSDCFDIGDTVEFYDGESGTTYIKPIDYKVPLEGGMCMYFFNK